MAYQLQPGLTQVDAGTIPKPCAKDFVFDYPVPSSLNYFGRPQTMVYGTAPYMAGNGAPGDLIMVSDELRPQSTTQFGKIYVDTLAKNTFPWQNVGCLGPQRTMAFDPSSTRAGMQNAMFVQRYFSN
jgi:hypothetical protein